MWLNLLSVSFVCVFCLFVCLLLFLFVFGFLFWYICVMLTIEVSFHFGKVGWVYNRQHHSCVPIYTSHVLSGHNWKKTGSIFIAILVLLVLLATNSGIWLLVSLGK